MCASVCVSVYVIGWGGCMGREGRGVVKRPHVGDDIPGCNVLWVGGEGNPSCAGGGKEEKKAIGAMPATVYSVRHHARAHQFWLQAGFRENGS